MDPHAEVLTYFGDPEEAFWLPDVVGDEVERFGGARWVAVVRHEGEGVEPPVIGGGKGGSGG